MLFPDIVPILNIDPIRKKEYNVKYKCWTKTKKIETEIQFYIYKYDCHKTFKTGSPRMTISCILAYFS